MSNRTASRARFVALALTTTCLSGIAHAGAPLPVGGSVSSGNAQIGTSGATTTVTQSSQRAVIGWQSFDVGAGNKVVFAQPDAQSATLNRVTGATTSTIAGQITSNGAVYLVNPNGIAITSTGAVQTGGGFIASTLDIADSDFNAGKLNFTGSGASKGVTNAGSIAAGSGAYVALLGGSVSNSGTISVPLGRVGLGSGESIALDLNGDGFMQVAVPSSLATSGIDMSGSIAGARVELRAAALKDAIRNIVNVPGSINADSATGDGGTITLIAGGETANLAGKLTVSGTLSARATGATGNGGNIETSGASVAVGGASVNTTAVNGKTGTWTIDPAGYLVAASGGDITGAQLGANLNTSNVTITSSSGTHGTVNNIDVSNPVTWTSTNTLTLQAAGNINLNSAVTGTLGGLTLTPGNGGANTGAVTASGAVNVGVFNLTNGAWTQNTATLPAFAATDFRFNPATASFVRATGGTGASGSPYLIADVYGVQGIASSTLLAQNFMLSGNIDASGTAKWNAGAGFVPIGTDGANTVFNSNNGFTGTLDGAIHTVSGLTIALPNSYYVGLFGYSGGTIKNLGLVGGSVTGANSTGGLVGYLAGGAVTSDYASGPVAGTGYNVGGLVGQQAAGAISKSSASGSVFGSGSYVGGLVGNMVNGSIASSYATGPVSNGNAAAGGYYGDPNHGGNAANSVVGGLVGMQSGGSIGQSYATGAVTSGNGGNGADCCNQTGASGFSYAGGLVGSQTGGTLTQSYATGAVTSGNGGNGGHGGSYYGGYGGATVAGGLIGSHSAGTIDQSYASGAVRSGAGGNFGGGSYKAGGGGGSIAGGLIGAFSGGGITRSYATGAVTSGVGGTSGASRYGGPGGDSIAGGLIGLQYNGNGTATLSQTYATGSVTGGNGGSIAYGGEAGDNGGNSYVGGLVGVSSGGIAQSYATGGVTPGTGGNGAGGTYGGGSNGTAVAGGLVGGSNGSTITKSYWDSYSTGYATAACGDNPTCAGVTAVTSDPAQTAAANYAFKSTAYSNFDVAAGIGTANPTGFIFAPGGSTRPFLASEVPYGIVDGTNASNAILISSAHELQLIDYNATTLSARYALANSIDLSETGPAVVGKPGTYAGMWGAAGFVPLGTDGKSNVWNGTSFASNGQIGFSGTFDGKGFILSNLSIVRPTANYVGLFGYSTASSLANIGLIGGGVSGNIYVGALDGDVQSNNTVSNSYATASVKGAGYTGGLVGFQNAGTITQSYATGTVTSSGSYAGGLVGYSISVVTQSYATGAVTSTGNATGGLVGGAFTVTQSYATGTVSGKFYVGGLIGTSSNIINQNYASGAVTGTAILGGLIGQVNGGSVANSYYDTYSTLQNVGIGGGTATGTVQVTSAPTQSAAANYAFKTTAYGSLPTATGIGTATPGGFVFLPGNITRPMLAFEVPTAAFAGTTPNGSVLISSSHQLQLINYDATRLSANYALAGNIDLSATGLNKGTAATTGGVWAAGGFSPIGTDGAGNVWNGSSFVLGGTTGFSTIFDGRGFTLSNLTIARPTVNFIGLFGVSRATITNINLAGDSIKGNAIVGGLVGNMLSGSVSGSSSTGNVTGVVYTGGLIGNQAGGAILASSSAANVTGTNVYTGGLLGSQSAGTLDGSRASGSVSGTSNTGGLIGYQYTSAGSVTNSQASGAVTGTTNVGGLIGYEEGNVANSSASGTVTGTTSIGGLVGRAYSGSITGSGTAITSTVTGTSNYLGGLIGYQDTANTLTSGTAGGAVNGTSASSFVGGLIGGAFGAVSASGATGAVSGNSSVGGAFGTTGGSASVVNTTASGAVTGTSYVGGFVGTASNTGTFAGSSANGNVTGVTDTGGFVGYSMSGNSITGSSASGIVTGSSDNTGGFAGYVEGALQYDNATGAVNGARWTGGFAGRVVATNTILFDYAANGAVRGTSEVGGLVGQLDSGSSVSGSYATGAVTGTRNNVGGLVGTSAATQIDTSYATGVVTGASNVGGLIGTRISGNVLTSDASGTVNGTNAVGGLIGLSQGTGTLTSVKAIGVVLGDQYVGGLIGFSSGGDIADAYATGNFGRATSSFGGGLIGYQDGGTVTRTYATGMGSGTTLGGLIGYQAGGSITASVWDTQTSNLSNGFGYQSGSPTFSATGYTTSQLQDPTTTAAVYPGWNFSNVWTTPSMGIYPKLSATVAH